MTEDQDIFCVDLNLKESEGDNSDLMRLLDDLYGLLHQSKIILISIVGLASNPDKDISTGEFREQVEQILASTLCAARLYCKCANLILVDCFDRTANFKVIIRKISEQCRFLIELNLSGNRIGEKGAKIIYEAQFKFIQEFEAESAMLSEKSMFWLSRCQWRYLTSLNISCNLIKNKGIKSMVQGKFWSSLQVVLVSNNGLTSDCSKLLKKNGWGRLQHLYLDKGIEFECHRDFRNPFMHNFLND